MQRFPSDPDGRYVNRDKLTSLPFTIFTPTYNRASTLPRVYASLKNQTVKDFEWLIVDDGSTDNTEELVRQWQAECKDFAIRYVYQENRHKKVAHNRAVAEARGELFVVLDSDDSCLPGTVETFRAVWTSIPPAERDRFVGVCCLCQDEAGRIVGDRFPGGEHIDSNSLEIRFRHKVWGEKWGCNRTRVLRDFPFREDIPGLVGEGTVWDAIAKSYRIRFFNKALRIYHQDVPGLITRSGEKVDFRAIAPGQVFGRKLFLDEHFDWFFFDPLHFFKLAVLYSIYWLNCPAEMRLKLGYWPVSWRARALVAFAMPLGLAFWAINFLKPRVARKQV